MRCCAALKITDILKSDRGELRYAEYYREFEKVKRCAVLLHCAALKITWSLKSYRGTLRFCIALKVTESLKSNRVCCAAALR